MLATAPVITSTAPLIARIEPNNKCIRSTLLPWVGANAHGLFYNGATKAVPDITTFGSRALFAGFDANGLQ